MRYVVGVDGGGTKTTAVVYGENSGVQGTATTGPSNSRSIGIEEASGNIARSIARALSAANLAISDVSAICTCLSGFDTDLDLPVPQSALRQLNYTGPAIMENDVVAAWAGATGVAPGLVLIAGTGATGLGMNARGELWRTDGWDYILGDAGSGYAIGIAGIRAAMQMLDGRRAPSHLVLELKAAYGVDDAEQMRRLVDSTHFGKFEIAAFAARVSDAATKGDPVARDLLGQAGVANGESGAAIIRLLGMRQDTFTVSTVGGVFKAEPWVTEPFHRVIAAVAPRATFRPPLHPPEVGAAVLALRRLDDDDLGSWTLGAGKRRIRRSLRISELNIP